MINYCCQKNDSERKNVFGYFWKLYQVWIGNTIGNNLIIGKNVKSSTIILVVTIK